MQSIIDKIEEHFDNISIEEFEKNLEKCGINKDYNNMNVVCDFKEDDMNNNSE